MKDLIKNTDWLEAIVAKCNLPVIRKSDIITRFAEFTDIAEDWNKKALAIVVKNVNDIDMIEKAREARLTIRRKRLDIEHSRKEMKESPMRECQAIDAVASYLTELISPIEKHLDEQEKFPIIEAARIKAELRSARTEELSAFVRDTSFYDLGNMPEESYAILLASSKIAFEQNVAKKIEEEYALQLKNATEEARMKKVQAEMTVLNNEKAKAVETLMKERIANETRLKKLAEEQKKALDLLEEKARKHQAAETAKRVALEDAERLRLAKLADEQRKLLEAEKEAAKAPDRKKIKVYISALADVAKPVLRTKDAKEIFAVFEAAYATLIYRSFKDL